MLIDGASVMLFGSTHVTVLPNVTYRIDPNTGVQFDYVVSIKFGDQQLSIPSKDFQVFIGALNRADAIARDYANSPPDDIKRLTGLTEENYTEVTGSEPEIDSDDELEGEMVDDE